MQTPQTAIKALQTAINRARFRMEQHTAKERHDKAKAEKQHLEGLQYAMEALTGPPKRARSAKKGPGDTRTSTEPEKTRQRPI